jgi:predicted amidohydrolase YtcJ
MRLSAAILRRTLLLSAPLLLSFGTALAADPPIRLFYDARVFTGEPTAPYADAVAIQGDKILAVGDLSKVEPIAGPGAERIDLKGRFLMPGMIDAHAHPIWGGLTLIEASFPDLKVSIPGLAAFVDKTLASGKSRFGDVLVIYGLDIGYWTHTPELNAAFSGKKFAAQPVVLIGSDGHTTWANGAALGRAGITKDFVAGLDADHRRYYGVDKAGNPNGFLVDAGQTYLMRRLPKPSRETMLEAAHAAIRFMNGFGITGWLDAAASGPVGGDIPATFEDAGFLPIYQELSKSGELHAHVAAYPVIHPDGGSEQIAVVKKLQAAYQNPPDLTIPGLKVFADGVVEIPSQTAVLTTAYHNTGKLVPVLFTPSLFADLVTEADKDGLVVHVHAIGDLAVKAALDGFAAARKANGMSKLPHTITHAQFVDAEDIPRFADLNILAALQLLWAIADPSTNEVVKPYIDASIWRTMYPARALLEAGTVIAGASDWPVSSPNPFEAIYQAETRRGPQGILFAEQRMPREAMLYAYTKNAARVIGQEDRIGTIAPGKQADLVLVDRDVLTVSATEARDAKVVWTMLGGKTIFGTGP